MDDAAAARALGAPLQLHQAAWVGGDEDVGARAVGELVVRHRHRHLRVADGERAAEAATQIGPRERDDLRARLGEQTARRLVHAELPNVACKLSGLATEFDPQGTVQLALGWFGAERCMFGSDWPVWPDYGGALALVPDDDEVLAGTAVRTYGLEVT